jgi:hypothetical protein
MRFEARQKATSLSSGCKSPSEALLFLTLEIGSEVADLTGLAMSGDADLRSEQMTSAQAHELAKAAARGDS